MSFRFSSAGSSFTAGSDFTSEMLQNSPSRTLSEAGGRILNNSYPQITKKLDIFKENQTFAYLEHLKHLQAKESEIEHIHHMRYLDNLDFSFKKLGKDLNTYATDHIIEPVYKPEETKKKEIMPEGIRKAVIKIRTVGEEWSGIVLPYGLVVTAGISDKKRLKDLQVVGFEGMVVGLNKFGPFVGNEDFALIAVKDWNLGFVNPYASFRMQKMDEVYLPGVDDGECFQIVEINQKYFAFSSRTVRAFVKAVPVFSRYWELQGIYSHSILNLHFVLRMEPIFAYLMRVKGEVLCRELDDLLSFYTKFSPRPEKKAFV